MSDNDWTEKYERVTIHHAGGTAHFTLSEGSGVLGYDLALKIQSNDAVLFVETEYGSHFFPYENIYEITLKHKTPEKNATTDQPTQ